MFGMKQTPASGFKNFSVYILDIRRTNKIEARGSEKLQPLRTKTTLAKRDKDNRVCIKYMCTESILCLKIFENYLTEQFHNRHILNSKSSVGVYKIKQRFT